MSQARKERKAAKKANLGVLYQKLGITEEILQQHQHELSSAEDTKWCPATFLTDDGDDLCCESEPGHKEPHTATVPCSAMSEMVRYCWPEIRDDRACEDYLRRKYSTYMPYETEESDNVDTQRLKV